VGPRGNAGQGGEGRDSPESRVNDEGRVEAAARRRSKAATESSSQGGRRQGPAAGGGNEGGERPPGRGESDA
jgi:hypothetical protein